jgi:hypothetical protein
MILKMNDCNSIPNKVILKAANTSHCHHFHHSFKLYISRYRPEILQILPYKFTVKHQEGIHDSGSGPKFIFYRRSQTTEVVMAQIISLHFRK